MSVEGLLDSLVFMTAESNQTRVPEKYLLIGVGCLFR